VELELDQESYIVEESPNEAPINVSGISDYDDDYTLKPKANLGANASSLEESLETKSKG
jgi:hypothetical protein